MTAPQGPPWPAVLTGMAPPGTACSRCGRPATLITPARVAYCAALDCYEAYVAAATGPSCPEHGAPDRPAPEAGPAAGANAPEGAAAGPGTPRFPPVPGVPGHTSRPGRERSDAAAGAGTTGVRAWKDALAAHHKAQRQRRGKRPGPQITGVRIPPPGGAA